MAAGRQTYLANLGGDRSCHADPADPSMRGRSAVASAENEAEACDAAEHEQKQCEDTDEKIACLIKEVEHQRAVNSALRRRLGFNAYVDQLLRREESSTVVKGAAVGNPSANRELIPSAQIDWDSRCDRMFARSDKRFDRVCHVFHQEWFGIRAAAGALPGHKLAISCAASWSAEDITGIVQEFNRRGIRAVVMHGMSQPMGQLVKALHHIGCVDLYFVWHGTTNQWANKDECELALLAIDLNRGGCFRAVHAIRSGLHEVFGGNAFIPQLLNMPPSVSDFQRRRRRSEKGAVLLCPSWNDIRKNLYTNVLAGAMTRRVSQILVLAPSFVPPYAFRSKIQQVQHHSQAEMLRLMADSDVVGNATVVDCHPMVNVEALAVGTPTIEGPLFLDALEDHPYKVLVRVDNPLSVADVKQAINTVLSVPAAELDQMLQEYRELLAELAVQRYLEFLGTSL